MTRTIVGYEILEKIFESSRSIVYRARKVGEAGTVILKCPADDSILPQEIKKFVHEYEVLKRCQIPGVVTLLALERQSGSPMLVFKDSQSEALRTKKPYIDLGMVQKLSIAKQVASTLASLHQLHVVHKDINPSNIILKSESDEVKIIDFGLASLMEKEHASLVQLDAMGGSLPYMSPEQTGRMNRTIDHRSDLYSFGATLYELFTGAPPFPFKDELKVVHYHLAKLPDAPHHLNESLPEVVSHIIMKLLAKAPEERYQSAWGVYHDLARVLEAMQKKGQVELFKIATKDCSDRFLFPGKLYGREQEISALLKAFDRVCEGSPEVMVVSGYPGVGKTSLVKEIYRPITARRGYFVSGRFSKLSGEVPYSALREALCDLIQQLLGEKSQKLTLWRQKILEAISPNQGVILEFLPELKPIIGEQSAPVRLPSAEAQRNRFDNVFLNFIKVFCRPEHPFVLFLDNLQWVDQSSLTILTRLVNKEKTKYLFLILSIRNQNLSALHPTCQFLDQISSKNIHYLEVPALDRDQLCELLVDAFHRTREQTMGLARVIMTKTQGNPFFTEQFLESLIADRLVWFEPAIAGWEWDIDRIAECHITDNVVDLLSAKILKTGGMVQAVLQLGAALGQPFGATLISEISGKPREQVHRALKASEEMLFIAKVHTALEDEQCYGFCHDRFQQAAFALLDKDHRKRLHLKIGRYFLAKKDDAYIEDHIFNIVSQLNNSIEAITDPVEKVKLVKLNYQAGKKSIENSAFANALSYFNFALSLVEDDIWQSDYSFSLSIHQLAAEAAFISSEYERMNWLLNQIFKNGKGLSAVMPAYEIKMQGAIAQDRFHEAILMGRDILAKLGRPVTSLKSNAFQYLRLKASLLTYGPALKEKVLALKMSKSPLHHQILRFQAFLIPCLKATEPNATLSVILSGVRESLLSGAGTSTPLLFLYYASQRAAILRDYEGAVRFAHLGLGLYKRLRLQLNEAPLIFVHCMYVKHWVDHIGKTLPSLEKGYKKASEQGDHAHAQRIAVLYSFHSFYASKPLREVNEVLDELQLNCLKMNFKSELYALNLMQQVVYNLRNPIDRPYEFSGPYFDEKKQIKVISRKGDEGALFLIAYLRMLLSTLFCQYGEAHQYAKHAQKFLPSKKGTAHEGSFRFYQSIALLRHFKKMSMAEKLKAFFRIRGNIRLLKKWASCSPINFSHRYYLVKAEWHRIKGAEALCQRYYDQAARAARKCNHLLELGFIQELCASTLLSRDSLVAAAAYMKKARFYYQRYGCHTKVKRLESLYPELIISPRGDAGLESHPFSTSSVSALTIDIATLKTSLLAIAEEKIHSKMIEKIISSAIQFAGASRGVLLLKKDDDVFYIEADGSVDEETPKILQGLSFDREGLLPQPVIHYVIHTQKYLVIDNAQVPNEQLPGISMDEYVKKSGVKSVLCIPIKVGVSEDALTIGILYLENCMVASSFTSQRIEILEIICLAAAGRLELSLKAASDGLTGLFNHEYFQNILRKELHQSRRQMRDLSLIMLDIDHFKSFNDQWGHQVGDAVLKRVAQVVLSVCRSSDVVARYGGEEISILLPETRLERAMMVAERIRGAIDKEVLSISGKLLQVTVSLGVSSLSDQVASAEQLIDQADQALYQSKASGRNLVTQYLEIPRDRVS